MTLSTADRLEILDVIARADWAATRRDADAYVQLFTEDAVLDGDQGHPEPIARSVLLIIDPDPPVTIRTAVIITQTLRHSAGSWRIARRTVGAAGGE
jgi:hypothetical protein